MNPTATIYRDAATHTGDAVDRILDAAERMFAEHGLEGVSMNAIAEAAGVSKANVFHHFSSKNLLYLTVVRRACQDANRHLDDLGASGTPIGDRLAQFARAHLDQVTGYAAVTRLVLREMLNDNPQLAREIAEQVYGEKFSRFVAILKSGQDAGMLRTGVDPAMVATMLVGTDVFFFLARDILRHFPDAGFVERPDQFSAMLADILLHGIVPTANDTTADTTKRKKP